MPLATLGPGELFGEIALLDPDGKRQATVTTVEPLLVLSLYVTDLQRVLKVHPELQSAFAEAAEEMLEAKFLKQASPFTTLDAGRLRWLASRLKRLSVPAGETIVRQGAAGEVCYLLRSGRVEVVMEEEGGEGRDLAMLEAGALFGEAALLTDAGHTGRQRTHHGTTSFAAGRAPGRPSPPTARSVVVYFRDMGQVRDHRGKAAVRARLAPRLHREARLQLRQSLVD